jgi:hypothetical protein
MVKDAWPIMFPQPTCWFPCLPAMLRVIEAVQHLLWLELQ